MEAWKDDDSRLGAAARSAIRRFDGDPVGLDLYAGKLLERGEAGTALALHRVLLSLHGANPRERAILGNRIAHCHQLLGDAARARTCHQAVAGATDEAVRAHPAGREAMIDSLMQLARDPELSATAVAAMFADLAARLHLAPGDDRVGALARRIWIPEAQAAILGALVAVGEVERARRCAAVFREVLADYGFDPLTLSAAVRAALAD